MTNKSLMDVPQLACAVVVGLFAATAVLAEDPYLHSDGTQYIDTGYVIKSNTRIELDMQPDVASKSGDQYLFGTFGDRSGKLAFCSYLPSTSSYATGKYCYCCRKDTSDWVSTGYAATADRRTIIMDAYHNVYAIVQGGVTNFTKEITGDHADCDSGVTMPVFAAYSFYNDSRSGYSAFKLYSLKIYESDRLVAKFVPCLWEEEAGLKDTVGGTWHSANGGNALTAGGDDILRINDGYIESTGSQYVDSLYRATGETRVEIDMAFSDLSTVSDNYPFGVRSATGLNFAMFVNTSSYCGWNLKDDGQNWDSYGVQATTGRRTYVIDAFNNKCLVVAHGKTIVNQNVTTTHTETTLYPMTIFGVRTGSASLSGKTRMKLYGFRIYERGELVRNFIPCVRDGVTGLKETQTCAFYMDRSGSATGFSSGGDILRENDDPYIRGEGFQALDTGIYGDSTTRLELDLTIDNPAKSSAQYLFGSTTPSSGNLIFGAYADVYGNLVCNCQKDSGNWGVIGALSCVREKLVFDVLNGKVMIYENGVLKTETAIATDHGSAENILTTKYTMPILANNNGGALSDFAAAKLYSCKIYKNDVLVNDFEPYVKDAVVGLRDVKNDSFVGPPRSYYSFAAGGPIEANVEEDASLRSNQRQAINTGYVVNENSRIEIDFAFNQHTNALERVFGATAGGDYPFGLYANSVDATWGYYCFKTGPSEVFNTMIPVDIARHTAIMDMKNKWLLFVTGSTTNYWKSFTALPSGTVWPMGLFGEPANASFTAAQNLSNLRIYSVMISEGGRLVHHYLPYRFGDVVGLKDVVTGDVKEDVLGSGGPFAIGCRGWGENHAAFYENPVGGTISSGETKVLSVFAPGAVAYQWLKNGEPIAGATGTTCSVSWQRRVPSVSYSVRADFDRYGVKVQSTSAAATIVNRPNGMVIMVR